MSRIEPFITRHWRWLICAIVFAIFLTILLWPAHGDPWLDSYRAYPNAADRTFMQQNGGL